jgi:soluble lytic murein transglycosylase
MTRAQTHSVLLLAGLCAAAPLAAEVKLDLRSDGVKVIRNEPAEARERRLSARLLPPPTPELAASIERWSAERDLDPRLVQAVMQAESGYNSRALSNKGAIGLMQLMPETALELAVEDPWDPDQNVGGGTAYLRRMLDAFSGDVKFAVAAYNAGPNAVVRHAGVPPYAETREYVRKVLCLFEGECGEGEPSEGRKVYIVRDAQNRIVLTTSGPGG